MNIDLLEPGTPPGLNVLVIAYYFPPMGLSGVQRTLKFVKYLPEFGWRPIILTPSEMPYYAHDESLMEELDLLLGKDFVRIVRTPESGAPHIGYRVSGMGHGDNPASGTRKPDTRNSVPDTRRLKLPSARVQRFRSRVLQTFYQPDSRIGWKKHALKTAEHIFREERIDAMFATAPPFTSLLIARELSEKYHVPYLMDYRDAWVANKALNFYATPFHKAYARKLEDECLRGSSAVTVVSRAMKEALLRNYPFLRHEDVIIVPHGFDAEDIYAAAQVADTYRRPEKFRVAYGGAFYVGYPGRSPIPMFEAITLAIKKEPEFGEDLELVIVGLLHKEYTRAITKMGLAQNVDMVGYLPHRQELAELLASDVLWMIVGDPLSTPGKLYEYLGTHKPILGLVEPGSQSEKILKDYGAGISVGPKDVPAIADALLDLYHRWRKTQLPHNINLPFVEGFDRKRLSKEMARQLGLMLRP